VKRQQTAGLNVSKPPLCIIRNYAEQGLLNFSINIDFDERLAIL
jgi:hypothetical protein